MIPALSSEGESVRVGEGAEGVDGAPRFETAVPRGGTTEEARRDRKDF